jgi:hypothetical protein
MYFAFFGFSLLVHDWLQSRRNLPERNDARRDISGCSACSCCSSTRCAPRFLASLDQYSSSRRKVLDNFSAAEFAADCEPRAARCSLSRRLAASLTEGLGSYWVKVVMSRDLFTNWDSDSDKIVYLPDDDPFWVQARTWVPRSRYAVHHADLSSGRCATSCRVRGAFHGNRHEHKFKAGIMISERRDNMPYYREDVRFMRQVIREAEVLIQNYLFLIENVKAAPPRARTRLQCARIQKARDTRPPQV